MHRGTSPNPEQEVAAVRAALAERYAVEGVTGSGATALVFRAQDLRHDRPVALKVLRPDVAAAFGTERFLREIGLVARLQHPHIVPIYDSGDAHGFLYYVMPFIEGESLRARMEREGRFSLEETTRIVLEVAEALGFAHSRGIVHRDVKPENILLFRGHAMTADFGIAKIAEPVGTQRLTTEGTGLGTPTYMSPEQAMGGDDVDARADLYSLACVMYEMLEGEAPFTGRTLVELLARKVVGETPALHRSGEVPTHIHETLRVALDREPSGRFDTLAAFADALTRPAAPRRPSVPRGVVVPPAKSIAVLPFADRSGTPDGDLLGDGIAEDLISALSRLDGIRVIARSSAFAFKGKSQDVRLVAAELGVGAVLSGTVRLHGTRLRVTADLVEGATGFALWSERYDRALTDVFDVQDEISRAILGTLSHQLLGERRRLVEAPTANMDAYQAYLKGRLEFNERTPASLRSAEEHLTRAVTLDPAFALAHAGLADTRVILAVYGLRAPRDVMTAAEADADRALLLAPQLAEALTARASVRALFRRDWDAAQRDYGAALAAREQYATAHQWYAMHLLAPRGRFTEARVRLARARELDPLSAAIATSAGLLRHYERDHQQALSEFGLVLESNPRFGLAHMGRGLALGALGRHQESVEALQVAAVHMASSPEVTAALACAEAAVGDTARSREGLQALRGLATIRHVSPVLVAQVLLALEDRDGALAQLDEALAGSEADLPLVGVRPAFDGLRDSARFRDLVRTLGV